MAKATVEDVTMTAARSGLGKRARAVQKRAETGYRIRLVVNEVPVAAIVSLEDLKFLQEHREVR